MLGIKISGGQSADDKGAQRVQGDHRQRAADGIQRDLPKRRAAGVQRHEDQIGYADYKEIESHTSSCVS